MNIKETYTGHTSEVHIGRFAFFICLSENGVYLDDKEIISQAIHFNTVVLKGDMNQQSSISNFINKLKKKNKEVCIIIETDGIIKPVGIVDTKNILFVVNILLKNSNIDYTKRINAPSINWLNEIGALFKFMIKSNDDLDEVEQIISMFGINKKQIYLLSYDVFGMKTVIEKAKIRGYNFSFNLNTILEAIE